MNEEKLRELVELQAEIIKTLCDEIKGNKSLDLLKNTVRNSQLKIQSFEDSLLCNQEFSEEITDKGYFKSK